MIVNDLDLNEEEGEINDENEDDYQQHDNEQHPTSIKNPQQFSMVKGQQRVMVQFQKNQSESDFYVRDSIKRNQSLISGNTQNRIQLIVRIRPFLQSEQIKECLKVVNDQGIKLFKEYHQIHFKFDTILMPKDSQQHVFSQIQNIVQGFIMGINGTIFAYGQTGAGKTYSIMGGEQRGVELLNSQRKGILPRTLDFIFSKILEQENYQKFNLSVSFYEIYNEKIFDLLSTESKQQQQNQNDHQNYQFTTSNKRSKSTSNSQNKQTLELREEKDGYFNVSDLIRVQVFSIEQAYECLDRGLLKRATSSTSLNNQSSRSHSIFQIYLEKEADEGVIIRSKLRIVDLAGSEKYTIKKDLPQGEKNVKIQELTSINSSLSALGQCISALADPTRKHIPYRNSKLTKVLKDSLDESSNVALIICISPSIDSYKETFSTLQFADRAKKAILDGRNFSDSKLIQDQSNQGGLNNTLMRAYQEEKAIRKELEKFMKDKIQVEVFEELERLKQQNKQLQEQVIQLQQDSSKKSFSLPSKSCLKKSNLKRLANDRSPKFQAPSTQSPKPQLEEDPSQAKRVRFAQKLDNDDSLDSDTKERIEHNLKYNDDTIFDNISIFRDVNNSGLIHPRLVDKKDVHPSKMAKKYEIEEDEDDDENQENEEKIVSQESLNSQSNKIQQQDDVKMKVEDYEEEKSTPQNLMDQIGDQRIKQFWGLQNEGTKDEDVSPISKNKMKNKNNNNSSSQDMSKDLIDLENDKALQQIQQKQQQQIQSQVQQQQKKSAKGSGKREVNVGDKTMGTSKKRKSEPIIQISDQDEDQQYQQEEEQHQMILSNDQNDDGEISFKLKEIQSNQYQNTNNKSLSPNQKEQEDIEDVEDDDDSMAKDYHVCQAPEQFIEPDFSVNQALAEPANEENGVDQILSDSLRIEEDQLIAAAEEMGNASQDNQNTLILDSQSLIMDAGDIQHNRDAANLSQQMQFLEASSILNLQPYQSNQQHILTQFGPNNFQSSSNGNSSNVNTDVLTYSLTNTFSTIESLHDELAAIRSGLEMSQKRGINILKTIQRYAREIEENKMSEDEAEVIEEEENVKSGEESINNNLVGADGVQNGGGNGDADLNDDVEHNLKFIKDIKGYYNKIHEEIHQLKGILIDSNNLRESQQTLQGSPGSQKKHTLSERVPQKQKPTKKGEFLSSKETFNKEAIDKTQKIIQELKKEMTEILSVNTANNNVNNQISNNNYPYQDKVSYPKNKRQRRSLQINQQHSHQYLQQQQNSQQFASPSKDNNKTKQSMRVLELLEVLQMSLLQAVEVPINRKIQQQEDQQINKIKIQEVVQAKDEKISNNNNNQFIKIQETQNADSFQDNSFSILEKHQKPHQTEKIIHKATTFNQNNNIIVSNSKKNNSSNNLNKSPIVSHSLIHYEEMPSIHNSPNVISQQQTEPNANSNQRTPEIFKSLAKLDQSDELQYQSLTSANHNQNQGQNPTQGALNQNFFSVQSNNNLNNSSNNASGSNNNQDFQITLRSHSQHHHNLGLVEERKELKHLEINNKHDREKKKADNTLTLIFDSEDEDNQENENENIEDLHLSNNQIKEEIEEDYFLNEDSYKIERGSSVNRQVSNSFYGDASLLILANNLVMKQDNTPNQEQTKRLEDHLKKRSKSINSRNSKDHHNHHQNSSQNHNIKNNGSSAEIYENMDSSIIKTVERKEFFQQFSMNNQNKVSINNSNSQEHQQPPTYQQFQDQILQIQQTSQQQQQQNSQHKDSLNLTESAILNNVNDESSLTSKQSVLKYWNQFFNKETNSLVQNSGFTGSVVIGPHAIPRDNNQRMPNRNTLNDLKTTKIGSIGGSKQAFFANIPKEDNQRDRRRSQFENKIEDDFDQFDNEEEVTSQVKQIENIQNQYRKQQQQDRN